MDLLTDILREAGLHRRLLDLSALTPARALRFPCEKSIGLHIVVQGTVYLHAASLPAPLALHAGDIALMARGCDHVLSLHGDVNAVPVEPIQLERGVSLHCAPSPPWMEARRSFYRSLD